LFAKSAKIKRYVQRITQYRQNRLFETDQKKVCEELNGEFSGESVIPDAEESKSFWNGVWGVEKEHNRTADWLERLKGERDYDQQKALEKSEVMVQKHCKKIPKWRAPGWDGVQGFWIKRLDTMHGRIASQLNEILNRRTRLPEWMTFGRTVLCQKGPANGNAVDDFRPISCLPLMWKLKTGILADNMYDYLKRERIYLRNRRDAAREGVELSTNS